MSAVPITAPSFRSLTLGLGCILLFVLYPFGAGLLGFLLLLAIEAFPVGVRRGGAGGAADPARAWFTWLFVFAAISSVLAERLDLSAAVTAGMALLIWGGLASGRSLALQDGLYQRLVLPSATAGVIASAVATLLYWKANLGQRAHTLWTGENGTGTVLVLCAGLALGYVLSLRTRWRWLLLSGVTGLAAGALVATQSRGAWLGFAAMLLALTRHSRRLISVLLLAALILAVAASQVPSVQERIGRMFSLERNQDRLSIWTTSLAMLKDRPVFGVGPGLFSERYPSYGSTSYWGGAPAYAHNLFLQIAAETGLVGLLIFAAIIGRVALILFRLANNMGPAYWGLEAAFWGTLIHQQVDIPIWGASVGSGWWVLIGFALASYSKMASAGDSLGRRIAAQSAAATNDRNEAEQA